MLYCTCCQCRFKGDKKLEPSDRILCAQDGDKYTVTIKGVELKEAGTYNVKATNVAGSMSASAKLKVNGVCVVRNINSTVLCLQLLR